MPNKKIPPWKKSSLKVIIEDVFGAEICGEQGKNYIIEFIDSEWKIVTDIWPKKRFRNFPYENPWNLPEGTIFGMVLYCEENHKKIGAWPLKKYWNTELLKD